MAKQREQEIQETTLNFEREKMIIEEEFKAYQREFDLLLQDKEHAHEENLEYIKNELNPKNEVDTSNLDSLKLQSESRFKERELMMKEKESNLNAKLKALEIKQKDNDSIRKLQIAKENKNKYDNKTK